jgi:mono/diheme cytochrome c family protein
MARHTFPLVLAAATFSLGATSPVPTSTRQGVFSESQAAEGAQLYAVRCAMCHGKMLEGTYETPALQTRFIANWSKAPLSELYDYLGRAMPQFAPGSLKPDETAQILAYLLKSNAMPAGAQPLASDGAALKRIMIEPVSARAMPQTK